MKVWFRLLSISMLTLGCSQSVIRPYQVTRPDAKPTETPAASTGTPTAEGTGDATEGSIETEEGASTPANSTPTPPPANTPTVAPVPATGNITVTLSVIPPAQAGRYRNNGHIRSVWVTDAANKYIKTIHAFAGQRSVHLKRWQVFTNRTLDATTGATQTTPAAGIPITANWDLKDKAGAPMMTGDYKLWLEFSEANTPALDAGKTPADPMQVIDNTPGYEYQVVPFVVNNVAATKTDTSNAVFKDVAIKHVP